MKKVHLMNEVLFKVTLVRFCSLVTRLPRHICRQSEKAEKKTLKKLNEGISSLADSLYKFFYFLSQSNAEFILL